ncbi:MAG: tyrosine-type recombinase/integrase [Gallionella sp.]|nr:tyrosine-type recombinase/integrase [Gallionella sp.]
MLAKSHINVEMRHPIAVERKIGRHHIAFFRSILLGMDMCEMSDRYLETGMDLRRAKTTLVWIQDTLRQAALRRGRPRDAHLMRMRITATSSANESAPVPSLDEYRAEFDPDGFFLEKELIQSYLAAYPQAVDTRHKKRQRLIDKQVAALKWIEPLITAEPVRDDWVAAWFDTTISNHLNLAGIPTIGCLVDRVAERGYRWWVGVPRLGVKGAARIVAWLRGYESSLGALPLQSLAPSRSLPSGLIAQTRKQQTDVVPLESFIVPPDLDGRSGSNRYPGSPRIDASDDYRAVFAWLATKSGNPNTQRAYQKEAERILLWAILELGKAMSDLTVEDCASYRDWLSMMGRTEAGNWPFRIPQSEWIGTKKIERHKQAWRPFDGALSASSVKHALAIIGNLFEWLVRVQYCSFNPWSAVAKSLAAHGAESDPDVEFTRAFSVGQWGYMMDRLLELPAAPCSARLRFALPFSHATGLRLSELVDATIGRMYTMPLSDGLGVRWMLKVYGKGGKWRTVPLPGAVILLLQEYLSYRGLNSDIMSNPAETPLIAGVASNRPLTTSALSKAIRSFFNDIAQSLKESGKHVDAKAFERATVHWVRHTCGSYLALSGVPVNVIQRLLGHASLQTTSIYTDTSDENMWREVEGTRLRVGNAHRL